MLVKWPRLIYVSWLGAGACQIGSRQRDAKSSPVVNIYHENHQVQSGLSYHLYSLHYGNFHSNFYDGKTDMRKGVVISLSLSKKEVKKKILSIQNKLHISLLPLGEFLDRSEHCGQNWFQIGYNKNCKVQWNKLRQTHDSRSVFFFFEPEHNTGPGEREW